MQRDAPPSVTVNCFLDGILLGGLPAQRSSLLPKLKILDDWNKVNQVGAVK